MSEMVERIARAVGENLYGYCDPDVTPNTWAIAVGVARLSLETAREPDERAISEHVDAYGEAIQDGRTFWRDVIKEMLK